jgi:hypothetical protein
MTVAELETRMSSREFEHWKKLDMVRAKERQREHDKAQGRRYQRGR